MKGSNSSSRKSRSLFAAAAILLGCAACCALPFLAALGFTGAAAGAIAWMRSHELWLGIAITVGVLAVGLGWKLSKLRKS